MKDLTKYIQEQNISEKRSSEDTVYGVFFSDNTMYNFYYTPDDAQYIADKLNKESSINNCKVVSMPKSDIES